jgi:outer membrane protein insertion porin family
MPNSPSSRAFSSSPRGLFLLLAVAVAAACLAFPRPGAAAPQPDDAVLPRIAVLPFEVNAEPELDYLRETLAGQLAQRLADAGFPVVPAEDVRKAVGQSGISMLDLATARRVGSMTGAGYAVYGSMSQVGQSVSIDARLVDVSGARQALPLFAVKEGTGGVLPALDELAEKIKSSMTRREKIAALDVEGTRNLEKDVVLMRLKLQPGDPFEPKAINEELKRVFNLGYFDDVKVRTEDAPDGKKVVFVVKEKPRIQAIGVKGNEHLKQDEILQAMSSKAGSVLNPRVLADDLGKIRELYRKDGYYKADVNYQIEGGEGGSARLNIVLNEGNKLYIKKISIDGAKKLSESDLKGELALAERGWLSWLTGSGVLKEELLDRDASALEAYYANRGFMDVKVGQPEVDYKEDGIYVTFRVLEGDRYKVGALDFAGDLLVEKDKLFEVTKLDDLKKEDKYFDRSVLRDDIQGLVAFYSDFGYAKSDADAKVDKNDKDLTVNVTYVLTKNQKVYIRRLSIEGNDKTRDNVIRRQMRLADGALYSGTKLRRSNERLGKIDFFDKVDIETVPTDNPSEVDLKVKVKEKATGQLSAGAGYSSFDGPFVSGMIMERNLFGKGYEAGISGTFSGRTNLYKLSFTNPNVYDTELAMGGDAYLMRQDMFDYNKDTTGGRVRWAYPVGEYSKLLWNYRLEHYKIYDIDDSAAQEIKDLEGKHWTSAAYFAFTRDTTDKRLNPSSGTIHTASVEMGGGPLGGDDDFIRYILDSSYYTPLIGKAIFHWHGQGGYMMKNFGGDEIQIFERFYLGGINSVRGYSGNKISPVDKNATSSYIGGETEFFTNFELLYPLYQEFGLMGVTFFDAGNTWGGPGENTNNGLYKSVGAGLRWYSPMGPLRIEYGYGLDKLQGGSNSKVEFSVGQFF